MRKIIKYVFTLLFIISIAGVSAQNTKNSSESGLVVGPFPVFQYGTKMVYSNEFMRVFNKNKRDEKEPTKEEIEEYLDLYVKFKLKVSEAYARQMDTVPSFINELAGYRKQLAQPYLTDKTVTERLIKEAYDRMQEEVRASHLLINCALDAKPNDTMIAYKKVMNIRKQILDGADFGDMAAKYSEDQSARVNRGDLGYFTAFQMIYPFENAAFAQKVGEVSMPVRTQFGYHLVYLVDRRESIGDMQVSHIMMKYYNEGQVDSVRTKIDAVYNKLQEGADWTTTVSEFSDDFNTNSKGGMLGWFNRTTANMPTEFKDAAYSLKKDGDISEPIKTKFGWHIVRRELLKEKQSFEEAKDALRRKVERDSRSELNKEVVLERVKKENKYLEVAGMDAVMAHFDESLLMGKYKLQEGNGTVLFTIDGEKFTDTDFYIYVARRQGRSNKTLENVVADYYTEFVKQTNLDYEESILELKYQDFKHIMQEYKDGILLFELTDKEVWSKAVEDSAGLEAFYAANSDKYMWQERAVATVFSCKDAKSAKQAKKLVKKGVSVSEILERCNAKDPLTVSVETKTWEKGKSDLLDKIEWAEGLYDLDANNDRVKFVEIAQVLPSSVKPLEENMGQATSDYQNYLEALWIENLRKKYPVHIYEENIPKLYK